LAVINGNQKAYNSAMIAFLVLEDVEYKNTLLKRNTYLYGVAKIIDVGRVDIKFSCMFDQGGRIPINLKAYDQLYGYEGLLINDELALQEIENEANNELN